MKKTRSVASVIERRSATPEERAGPGDTARDLIREEFALSWAALGLGMVRIS